MSSEEKEASDISLCSYFSRCIHHDVVEHLSRFLYMEFFGCLVSICNDTAMHKASHPNLKHKQLQKLSVGGHKLQM